MYLHCLHFHAGRPCFYTVTRAFEAPVTQHDASEYSLPAHIGIIMDGNGRWAQQRSLPRTRGHKAGAETVRRIVTASRKLGIEYLTLFSFSTENWSRPKEEIAFLFGMLVDFLGKETDTLMEHDIRLQVFGDVSALPLTARTALGHVLRKTKCNGSMTLNLALNYSGREDILQACRRYIANGGTAIGLTDEALAGYLYSAGQPDPDLIIRTSGELRISNFMLYQSAYSELYFTPVLWPDFTEEDLHQAIDAYAGRHRRFGGL